MRYKFLQLNIYRGRYLPQIIDCVKLQDLDILNLQEVAGGRSALSNKDCFDYLSTSLKLRGELSINWFDKHQPKTYMGNATFYKPYYPAKLQLKSKEIIWLKGDPEIERGKVRLQDLPRNLLCTTFQTSTKLLTIINCHLAWGPNPNDRKYKLIQGEKLYQFVKNIKTPFILSGDFNVTPDSEIVNWISQLATNLTTKYQIKNTLNPNTHRAKKLFPQGLAVDYIFTSKDIKIIDFKLVNSPSLSDHFGLKLEFKL